MTKETLLKLQEPFDDSQIKFKLQARSGNMGMFVPFIDARDVIKRLNDVVGPDWHDEYEITKAMVRGVNGPESGYMARCRLTIAGIAREDIGEGQFPKDAVSDALKRAAVKFGIGIHLYEGAKVWVEVDDKGNPQVPHEEMLAIWRGEKQASKPSGGGYSGGTDAPASEKQIKFLSVLLKKAGIDNPEIFLGWFAKKNDKDQLTKKLATELIDLIKNGGDDWEALKEVYDEEVEYEKLF